MEKKLKKHGGQNKKINVCSTEVIEIIKTKGMWVTFKEIMSKLFFFKPDERPDIYNMQPESTIFKANSIPSYIVKYKYPMPQSIFK